MSKHVGKAVITDEHGHTHDECNLYLEDLEPSGSSATMTLVFERNLTVDKDHPILALEFFPQAVEYDARAVKAKTAEKKKGN